MATKSTKIAKDAAVVTVPRQSIVKGGKIANVTFFPAEGWRAVPKTSPVKGNLVFDLLGATLVREDGSRMEADLTFNKVIDLPVGSVPAIIGAAGLEWEARPVADERFAKCLFELDANGRNQFAAGRITFVGDDDERGLVLSLPLPTSKTLSFEDVGLSHQFDRESNLPQFNVLTDAETGDIRSERPVMWAHPMKVAIIATEAEFTTTARGALKVGTVRQQTAARRTAGTSTTVQE